MSEYQKIFAGTFGTVLGCLFTAFLAGVAEKRLR